MTKNSFWEDESGAIAVDWVVLTGSLVGLGVATMAVVSGGVEDLSRDIAGQLRSDDWSMFNNGLIELSNFDFSGGDAAGWIGGQVMDMGGEIGELLVIGPQAGAAFSLEVPEGTEMAYMAFDLVAGDSLDNGLRWGVDTATLMINNVPVALATDNPGGVITFDIPQVDGTTVQASVLVEQSHMGGNPNWQDSSARVTVMVDQPTADLQFQLVSDSNQPINDEFWGIDNFSSGTDGGPGF